MTGDQAIVEDETGLRHAGKQESGYSVHPDELPPAIYLFGTTVCGIVYAWHASKAYRRMHFVDPEDRYPTCLWCASCP